MSFYADYYWKEGKPCGLKKGDAYRILSDPYGKRYSIEEYREGKFFRILYDSNLFDFRLLFREEEAFWQREQIGSDASRTLTLIRDIHDRILLKEELLFENQECIGCKLYSPHDIPLGEHRLFRESRGDPYNGVLLRDLIGKPILQKFYAIDSNTHEFGTLLKEVRTFDPGVSV